jgi:hypothetical protein
MDREVNALMSAADEEHWERAGLFASVDASSGVNNTVCHPDEHFNVDLNVGAFPSTLPYEPHPLHKSVNASDFCSVQELAEHTVGPFGGLSFC